MSDQQPGPKKKSWAAKLKTLEPRPITLSREQLVTTGFLKEGETLPLVITPGVEWVDVAAWARANLQFIEASLRKYGGVLFRGFGLGTQADFEGLLQALSLPLMYYMEGATPRTELSEKVYTSTEYPPDQRIALHNELNYVSTWPMKISFFCETPAERGGETPIADVRRVYGRIHPDIREEFARKGWMLVRNFGDGMSLPWQTAFRVTDKKALEEYCRRSNVEFEWKGGGRLRTWQVRPAVRTHPKTGEWVWFNHVAFWHISSLDSKVRETFLGEFDQDDLPYNTYYGDGSTIPDSAVEQLRRAYDEETRAFPWQKGDLLLMDNMLVAHGRNPFEGRRRILTAMGEPFNSLTGGEERSN